MGVRIMEADETKVDRLASHMVRTATQSGIEVKAFYGPDDVDHLSYKDDLGDPGEYPFTRGTPIEAIIDHISGLEER